MKFIILTLAIFCTQNTFAQIPYTDFVQADTAIQWAAEYDQILNITPKIARFGIRNIMHAKLMRGECIDNYEIVDNKIEKTKYCLSDTIRSRNDFTSSINPFFKISYDFNENIISKKMKLEIDNAFEDIDRKTGSQILKLKQIIAYKSSNLYITNILVTPLILKKYSDSGSLKFTWQTNYTTCFNDSLNILTSIKKTSLIDLGTNYQIYNLYDNGNSDSLESKVITKGKPILSQQLFKDIMAKKITAIDNNGNILNNKNLMSYKASDVSYIIHFDGGGRKNNGTSYSRTAKGELNIESIYKFGIFQHFYYDSTKNILHSEVNYIDTYYKIVTPSGLELGEAFHFRIYFTKPSQYKKRPPVLYNKNNKMRLTL
jgi:hypothetical protein